ncbi:MAG: 5-formyltetrahydrofolate cyclo-ligase [Flavobacteriaceae bacterium]|nr:5-formyltetrahydrofolate cyclo-ligase [Flavobacteriaceae bacterium]
MEKPLLRKKYLEKRMRFTTMDIDSFSLAIANQSLKLLIWDKTYYHLFLTISEKKEVDTQYLLHILQGRDKSIVVPKADFNSGEMKHFLLQENTALKTSPYGIPEPLEGIEIPSEKIDVVFVPLLAFDTHGNRLGYGKGFYDRFLKACHPACIFVGLSFFEPEEQLEKDPFDIPLHFCITPEKIHSF